MALTYSIVERTTFGNMKVTIADITFDSSYPTNGNLVDFPSLGLNSANFAHLSPSAGYLAEFDYVNKKIKVRTPVGAIAAHTHVENTAVAYVQNAVTAAAGAITAGAAPEVANATNLSTLVVRCMFFGH